MDLPCVLQCHLCSFVGEGQSQVSMGASTSSPEYCVTSLLSLVRRVAASFKEKEELRQPFTIARASLPLLRINDAVLVYVMYY